jgi:hypothetical protein
MTRIGLLSGADQHQGQDWSKELTLQNTGSTDVYRLGGYPNEETSILQITKGYFRQPRRHRLDGYAMLINLVTDPDINGKVLKTMSRAIDGFKGPVLNPPDKVLLSTREAVARRLAGLDDVLVPRVRTVRSLQASVIASLEKTGAIAFPAIVRRAGTHSGQIAGVAQTAAALEKVPPGKHPHTLTEFVDYRSKDGLFRKYRVFYFGKTPVFRHQLISDRWNVHMADRARFMMARPALLAGSQGLYRRGMDNFPPRVRAALDAIHARMELDFCGIDFGILRDGRVILFEANATMNFLPISDDPRLAAMKLCAERGKEAFCAMVARALENREVRASS